MQQNQINGQDPSALSQVLEGNIYIHTMTVPGCSLQGHSFLVLIRHLQTMEENPR